jgi:hypothetical protein
MIPASADTVADGCPGSRGTPSCSSTIPPGRARAATAFLILVGDPPIVSYGRADQVVIRSPQAVISSARKKFLWPIGGRKYLGRFCVMRSRVSTASRTSRRNRAGPARLNHQGCVSECAPISWPSRAARRTRSG